MSASIRAGSAAQHRGERLEPGHVAVVVRTQDVDRALEPRELVADIRSVCCEVGRLPVRADEDPVLLVTVLARSGPYRSVGLVGIELGDRSRDLGLDDRLPLPRVDPDPEPEESRLDLAQHPRHGVSVRVRELVDVGTVVAVVGGLLAAPARGHRLTEPLDLPTGVVEVVLLLDRVGGEREQSSHAVAVRAVPRRADRERAGRVRRDELDLDPLGRRGRPRTVVARRGKHLRECLAVPGLTHREVEKPGPAMSILSTRSPRTTRSATSSAIWRGGRPSSGASRSATVVA